MKMLYSSNLTAKNKLAIQNYKMFSKFTKLAESLDISFNRKRPRSKKQAHFEPLKLIPLIFKTMEPHAKDVFRFLGDLLLVYLEPLYKKILNHSIGLGVYTTGIAIQRGSAS